MKGIRIETEKIVNGKGELTRKLVDIKCLEKSALPDKYLGGDKPIVYQVGNDLYARHITTDLWEVYLIREIVSEAEFQALLNHCHKAGDHLMSVNADLKAKRAIWNGEETFII